MSKAYLIDTNVISELCKAPHKVNSGVYQWAQEATNQALFTSVLVIGELRQGLLRLRRRDPAQADILQAKIDQLSLYTQHTLPINDKIVACWAELNVPDPLPVVDGLLAATALVHDLVIVTRNVQDFSRTGVVYINPFLNS